MEVRQNAGLNCPEVTAPSNGAVAGRGSRRKLPRVPLSQAPPLSPEEKEAQLADMTNLGVRLNEGEQIPIYENWPLWNVKFPLHFPPWPAGLYWIHKMLRLTVGILRHTLKARRFPLRCARSSAQELVYECLWPRPHANTNGNKTR